MEKFCTGCGNWKQHDAFPPLKRNKNGLNSYCRSCWTDIGRLYKSGRGAEWRARVRANKAALLAARALAIDKTCRTCGQSRSKSDFCRSSRSTDGYESQCKSCAAVRTRLHQQRLASAPKSIQPRGFCTRCRRDLPASEFHFNAMRRGGLAAWCKRCAAEKQKLVYAKAKAAIGEKNRMWRRQNPGRMRELRSRWAMDNHGKEMARLAGRRAKMRAGEAIDYDWVVLRDNWTCGICDWPVHFDWHIDHIHPLSKGGAHAYANVQVSHQWCNLRKMARHDGVPKPVHRNWLRVLAQTDAPSADF